MAGIGFELERMAQGRFLLPAIGSYCFALFLVGGPWIFTILAVGGISLAACETQCDSVEIFRSVIIYNSVISLIFTSPISYVCARYISDRIFLKQYDNITFALFAGMIVLSSTVMPIGGFLYFILTTLTLEEKIASIENLMLLGASWILIQFLGALRRFITVSVTFACSAVVMISLVPLAPGATPFWLLSAFNFGLGMINFVLLLWLTREYGVRLSVDFGLFRTALTHWELPLIGLTYSAGIWMDKLVMWSAAPPGALRVASALQTMPDYDTPMFWAQLVALPVAALFFVHVETNCFRLCRTFYRRIQEHASLRELEQLMGNIGEFVLKNTVYLFVALAAIGSLAILISFVAIDPLGLRAHQMGIFRNAIIGVVCHSSAMFCVVFFLYLDLRRPPLLLTTGFLVLNFALTIALIPLGSTFFGFGNMLASVITLAAAIILLMRELPWIHFHVFVTNNQSLKGRANTSR